MEVPYRWYSLALKNLVLRRPLTGLSVALSRCLSRKTEALLADIYIRFRCSVNPCSSVPIINHYLHIYNIRVIRVWNEIELVRRQ